MDNWDTFKINLEIAEESKGTLEEQFEIYQSGVEASEAALKNATQTLYEELLNPNALKGFNNALTEIIELVTELIQSAGGLDKILQFGGLLLLETVLPHLEGFVLRIASNLKDFIGITKKQKLDTMTSLSTKSHQQAGTKTMSQQVLDNNSRLRNKYSDKLLESQQKQDQYRNDKSFMGQMRYGAAERAEQRINNNLASHSDTMKTFMPGQATQIPTVDIDATGAGLRAQAVQEEAGYTAQILDTRKAIAVFEDGMTDKQKEQFAQYDKQVQQEQELLRIAREK
jgi:hypothetical protein